MPISGSGISSSHNPASALLLTKAFIDQPPRVGDLPAAPGISSDREPVPTIPCRAASLGSVSQYLLSECGTNELHSQFRGPVVLIENRIHFNYIQPQHPTMVREDLHRKMGFAVSRSARDRSAHSGRFLGIDPIHIHGNVITGSSVEGYFNSPFHHRAQAHFVDVAHGKYGHSCTTHVVALDGVNIADAHQH